MRALGRYYDFEKRKVNECSSDSRLKVQFLKMRFNRCISRPATGGRVDRSRAPNCALLSIARNTFRRHLEKSKWHKYEDQVEDEDEHGRDSGKSRRN